MIRRVLRAIRDRVLPERLRCYRTVKRLVAGKIALEVGGPTALFARDGLLPLYPIVGSLDNCNYSSRTLWEGSITEGPTFAYDSRRPPGIQYIAEASALAGLGSERYDVVLSSHTLEHTANPLGALEQWTRVLKERGVLVLVLPHKEGTFDHRRPVTTLAHLVEDANRGTSEHDVTHLPEILALHDLALDPAAGGRDAFTARSEKNFENRCLHHHVFDTNLAVEVVNRAGLQVLAVEPTRPHHIFVIARKAENPRLVQNAGFLGEGARYRSHSPFAIDRT